MNYWDFWLRKILLASGTFLISCVIIYLICFWHYWFFCNYCVREMAIRNSDLPMSKHLYESVNDSLLKALELQPRTRGMLPSN